MLFMEEQARRDHIGKFNLVAKEPLEFSSSCMISGTLRRAPIGFVYAIFEVEIHEMQLLREGDSCFVDFHPPNHSGLRFEALLSRILPGW